MSLFTYRAKACSEILVVLREHNKWSLDSIFRGGMMSAIAEEQSGYHVLVTKHMKAVIELLRRWQGSITIQEMKLWVVMPIIRGTISINMPPVIVPNDLGAEGCERKM